MKKPKSCWVCPKLGGQSVVDNVRRLDLDTNKCFVKIGSLELHCLSKNQRHKNCPLDKYN